MLKLIERVIFKFDENKELTHAMWEIYVSMFPYRQQKIETNKELFESFINDMRVITQYDGLIRQDTGIINPWVKGRCAGKVPGSQTGI